jgi:chitin disaccharide deacetylase
MKNTLALSCCFLALACTGQQTTIQEKLGYPKDAKLVIIHADDLGVAHSENAASTNAMEKGSVSSASIMVPTPWFPEIAHYAATHATADLGLHITLTSEWKYLKWGPVTAAHQVPGLVNKYGFLYSSVDSVRRSASATEVEEETRNQVKRAIQFGIDPTHLDSHMGTIFSRADYLKAYLKVGHEFKIPVFIPRQIEGILGVKFDSLITDRDVIVDHVVTAMPQHLRTGFAAFYTNALKNIQPGLTYLIIHTAFDNDEMKAVAAGVQEWGSAWRQLDYDFFTSAECARLLKENNIYVITWREIRDKVVRK